jgi:hypothetical protein
MHARIPQALFACLFSILLLGGCGTTPEQRLDLVGQWIEQGESWSQGLDEAVTAAELVLERTETALADPNVLPEEMQALRALRAEATELIAAYRAKKALVDADLIELRELQAKAQTEGAEVLDEVEFYGGGLRVLGNRIGGQAGGYVALAGTLLGALAGALAGLGRNAKTQSVLADVVTSVSALLGNPVVSDRDKAAEVLAGTQLPQTQKAVRSVLGKTG